MQTQERLSRYRDELKGFAILWIVLFHAKLVKFGFLYELTKIGYGGVDIFMLIAGFGLYRSLAKSAELGGYMKRRAARLLPSYLPFCALWLCVTLPSVGLTRVQALRTILGNLTMTNLFAGVPEQISWYMCLLLLSILLAPFIYACLNKAKKPLLCAGIWALLTLCVSVCFWGSRDTMLYSRLPIFIIGMLLAVPVTREMNGKARAALGFASFAVGLAVLYLSFAKFPVYLNDCGLYWYPFILVTPPLCAGLAWLFQKASKAAKWFAPLRYLGKASFEIFLFNCWAEVLIMRVGLANSQKYRLLFMLASVLAGCLYHYAVTAITAKARKREQVSA